MCKIETKINKFIHFCFSNLGNGQIVHYLIFLERHSMTIFKLNWRFYLLASIITVFTVTMMIMFYDLLLGLLPVTTILLFLINMVIKLNKLLLTPKNMVTAKYSDAFIYSEDRPQKKKKNVKVKDIG